MAGRSVQVKAERLKGVRVHAVNEKPGLALVEFKTAKGSQFYAMLAVSPVILERRDDILGP